MASTITAGLVLTPLESLEQASVLVRDGKIEACQPSSSKENQNRELYEFSDAILAPGYIDIHIHGAVGFDVMDCSYPDFLVIGRFLAKHGVTSYLPTTITAPLDDTLHALDRIAAAVERMERETSEPVAKPIGIHIEGPFISHARRGVHSPVHILPPSVALFDRFWAAARGRITMITIAPELPEALEVIAEATRRGVVVSLGHTNADYETALQALSEGASHATHSFNAMRRLEHRDPGVLGALLTDHSVTADIIVDGLHVLPSVVDLFLRCKGPDGAVLISDATSATGMPDGRYRLGSFEVDVKGLRCESYGKLAGSVLTLDVAIRNVMQFAGWPLANAVRLASHNPARVLGRERRIGQIVAGAAADLVVLSAQGDVLRTFIAGNPV